MKTIAKFVTLLPAVIALSILILAVIQGLGHAPKEYYPMAMQFFSSFGESSGSGELAEFFVYKNFVAPAMIVGVIMALFAMNDESHFYIQVFGIFLAVFGGFVAFDAEGIAQTEGLTILLLGTGLWGKELLDAKPKAG